MHSPESLRGGTEFCPACRKAVEVPDESLGDDDLFGDSDDEEFDDCDFDDDESPAEEEDNTGGGAMSTDSPMNSYPPAPVKENKKRSYIVLRWIVCFPAALVIGVVAPRVVQAWLVLCQP
jgi:hypothetical protein